MNLKVSELEDQLEQSRVRINNLEKTKIKLTTEIKELTIEIENVSEFEVFFVCCLSVPFICCLSVPRVSQYNGWNVMKLDISLNNNGS